MAEFPGASIAVLTQNEFGKPCVVAIRRDDKPDIPYPGCWELPGGTLEPGEDFETGAIRECREEVNIDITPEEVIGTDDHLTEDTSNTRLVIAVVAFEKVFRMRLGEEGSDCKPVDVDEFLSDPLVVPEHQFRLRRYLRAMGASALTQCRSLANVNVQTEAI